MLKEIKSLKKGLIQIGIKGMLTSGYDAHLVNPGAVEGINLRKFLDLEIINKSKFMQIQVMTRSYFRPNTQKSLAVSSKLFGL